MSEQNPFNSPYEPKPTKKKKRTRKSSSESNVADENKLVSYRLGSVLQERIRTMAKEEHVIQSELVRYILIKGLDALDNGELTLPKIAPEPKKMRIKL